MKSPAKGFEGTAKKKSPARPGASAMSTPAAQKSPALSATKQKSPASAMRTPGKSPKKAVSETPYKDYYYKEQAGDLDQLKEQINEVIEETRNLLTSKIDKISSMIEDLRNDFANDVQQ